MKAIIDVKLTNIDEFNDLVARFTKKAHELQDIAHELQTFRFTGEVQSSSDRD